MIRTSIYFIILITSLAIALDANTVFTNQKKAVFPDTAEIRIRTTVTLPGQMPQRVEVKVLSKGKDKSVTEIKSSQMNMKMIRNGQQMGMVDLKTGKVGPAQNMPNQPAGLMDFDKQFGSPTDYLSPVKEDSLWRLDPKDPTKPVLFYSEKVGRVVKMTITAQGVPSVSWFRYSQAGSTLPGTLSAVDILTSVPGQVDTKVLVEVISAQRRSSLSDALFTIPK